jgi:hypothetical protein
MATIYEFIIRSQGGTASGTTQVDADGNAIPLKGAGVKGGTSLTAHNPNGKSSGGVDHNRFMRPINPLINRWTGGFWEKGQRGFNAVRQLPADFHKNKLGALTGVASLILIQLAIMEFDKWFREQQKKAKEENKANFLKITSGQTVLGQDYKVSKNIFGGITYRNQ